MECPVDDQGCLGDQTDECLQFCTEVGSRPHRGGPALQIGGPHISPTRAPDLVPMIRTAQTCPCPSCTALRDSDETEPSRDPSKL